MQRSPSRRLLPVLLVLAVLSYGLPSPVSAVQSPSEPEARLLWLINDARQSAGRIALRWDDRLADVAQERSDEMAASGIFAHTDVAPRLAAKGIVWYLLAETILKGTPRTPMESAEEAMTTWHNSAPHWALLGSADYNYVALGMARASDGWYYWTALLIKGPDRTPPTASMTGAKLGTVASGRRSATISWTGADVRLSVLTAGLRDFRLQKRRGSGDWVFVGLWTTSTSRSLSLPVGSTFQFRVRARDKNGNKSAWSAPLTVNP
jgi:uncharacterized protein YkwD